MRVAVMLNDASQLSGCCSRGALFRVVTARLLYASFITSFIHFFVTFMFFFNSSVEQELLNCISFQKVILLKYRAGTEFSSIL